MAHNGGLSQANVNAFAPDHSFALLNLAKSGYYGVDQSAGLCTNADGYLISTPATPMTGSLPFIGNIDSFYGPAYTGDWVVRWSGAQALSMIFDTGATPAASIVTGGSFVSENGPTLIVEGTSPYVRFNLTSPSLSFRMEFNDGPGGANTMSDLEIYRADYESARDAGEIFNPYYIQKLREANFGIIRVGDLIGMTMSCMTRSAYLSSTTQLSYASGRYLPGAWVGSFTDVGGDPNVKACAAAPDTPVAFTHGEVIQGWNLTQPLGAPLYINSAGRGVKEVWSENTDICGTLFFPPSLVGANSTQTYYWNAYMDKWIHVRDGLFVGDIACPIEVVAELCNKVGCHAATSYYINADDDCQVEMTHRWNDNLNAGLKVYGSLNNENWNFNFPSTNIANWCGTNVLGLPYSEGELRLTWLAQETLRVFDNIDSVMGTGNTRFMRVIDTQMQSGYEFTWGPFLFEAIALGLSAPNRPGDRADALCAASYIVGTTLYQGGFQYGDRGIDAGLLTAADDYASGVPSRVTSAMEYVDEALRNTANAPAPDFGTLRDMTNTWWPIWTTAAANWGIQFIEYEGGIAVTGPTLAACVIAGVSTDYAAKIYDLIAAYKCGDYAKQFTLDKYQLFVDQPNGFFPSQYTIWGATADSEDTSNPWGIIVGGLYANSSQSYKGVWEGIVEFNGGIIPPVPDYQNASLLYVPRYISFKENGYAP